MAKWIAKGVLVEDEAGAVICTAHHKLAAQIEREHNQHDGLVTLQKMCEAIVEHNKPLPDDRERYYVRGDMFRRITSALAAAEKQ